MLRLLLLTAALLALPAQATDLRLGAGFATGAWRLDGQARRLNGGTAFAEWRPGKWRLTLSYRGLAEDIEEGGTGTASSHAGGLVGGYEAEWFGLALGAGLATWMDARGEAMIRPLPAGRVRLGPDFIYAEAALLELTPWSPGPGLLHAGVGFKPVRGRIFVGYVRDVDHQGLAVGSDIPLAGGAYIGVGAALDPTRPANYLVLGAHLSMDFRDDDWVEPAPKRAPASRPTGPIGPRDPSRPLDPTRPAPL